MGRTLKVHLTTPRPEFVHEFRNFGEDVYRALQDQCDLSIEEIDRSTSEFHLREIHKRNVRSVAAEVRKLAENYPRLRTINVAEITQSQG